MMKALPEGLPSACSMMPVGALSWIWKVLGSSAFTSATLVHSICPSGSRTAQRLSEGTTSVGRDRRAVMEFQPVAQGEGPGELVVGGRPLVDHLRLDLEVAVQREQRVVDHVAVVAHDVGRRPDRIEDLQIGVIDHPQGRLRPSRAAAVPATPSTHADKQPQYTIAHSPPPYGSLAASWGGASGPWQGQPTQACPPPARPSSITICAALSAIMIVGVLVLPEVMRRHHRGVDHAQARRGR